MLSVLLTADVRFVEAQGESNDGGACRVYCGAQDSLPHFSIDDSINEDKALFDGKGHILRPHPSGTNNGTLLDGDSKPAVPSIPLRIVGRARGSLSWTST